MPPDELGELLEDVEARAAELAEARDHRENALVTTRTSGRGVQREPDAWTPPVADYVRRCPASQYESNRPPLVVYTWLRGGAASAARHVALCGSWRCDSCCRYAARVAFARITEAFEAFDAHDVVFAVLTLDQLGRYTAKRWATPEAAYRELSRMSRLFMKRLNRWLRANDMAPVGSRWVATVESHRTGWPHLNLVMVSADLAAHVERTRLAALDLGLTDRQSKLAHGPLLEALQGSGWGPQCTLERARDANALAGYVVKVASGRRSLAANERGRAWQGPAAPLRVTTGEVAKITQRPLGAPKGFRRIRSGKGFLPPRRRSGMTGVVVDVRHREHDVSIKEYGRAANLWDRLQRLKDADVPSAPWNSETFQGLVGSHRDRRLEVDAVLELERRHQAAAAEATKNRVATLLEQGRDATGPPAPSRAPPGPGTAARDPRAS